MELQSTLNMWNLEKNVEEEKYKMSKIYFGKLISLTQNIIFFHEF